MAMAIVIAQGLIGDMDVDVMEGRQTSLGSMTLPLLNKPHDQPYPTQPSCCNSAALQILIPPLTSFKQSAPEMVSWEGECHVRAIVQQHNGMLV